MYRPSSAKRKAYIERVDTKLIGKVKGTPRTMAETPEEYNAKVIGEFRANIGRVGDT